MALLLNEIVFERDPALRQLVSVQAFKAWSDYQCKHSQPKLTGSNVKLRLLASNADNNDIPMPEPKHLLALRWLQRHEQALHDHIIAAIFGLAPSFKAHWRELEITHLLPPLNCAQDLKQLIDLSYIDIYTQTKDDLPYLGFEFECDWDPEHGFHVLTHGLLVVTLDGDVNDIAVIARDGGHS